MKIENCNSIESLHEYTTTLSLPILAGKSKKEEILKEMKMQIDERILALCNDKTKFKKKKESMWKQAEESACKEFNTLPDKLQLNSFYLQEVMHQYVELVKDQFFS